MTEAGNAIQAIKPIFMMSPLSVPKFLPPESVHFDWVIFDEASQVKPVDAFGAIIRGLQTIVVGDSKQLPPTDFFDKYVEVDDEGTGENLVDDMESILESFCAKSAPQRMLRWHYRSRHESLIAVSNVEFYDRKLQLFPSPDVEKKEVGLFNHYLPDTVYGRGGSRSNPEEARIVAVKVMEHAHSHPKLTLGVATFSAPQMEAVQDELELLRREDPSCEKTFFNMHPAEPFFVKNLENVQGDERDVIFISIGYGRDADGHLTMNFGPLNQDGGERRLNVLITRARRRCEVFTNLKADDIDLNRTDARGVEVLKGYLKYAETGELDFPRRTDRDTGSPFEEEVADALRELGYQIDNQIGSAGYFIDLAVKHPQQTGGYLLGIECDGATYHSAQSARDRDRLRQQVLEGLGWRIHRIWSTDWFNNPNRELRKVAGWIQRIVKIESPVHLDEVARRIAIAVGTSRIGNRIQNAVKTAAGQAAGSRSIEIRGDFLYWKEQRQVIVRDRSELPNASRKLELIAPEEIEKAIKALVSNAFGVDREDLTREVCRLFGYKSISADLRRGVESVLDKLIAHGELTRKGDSLVLA